MLAVLGHSMIYSNLHNSHNNIVLAQAMVCQDSNNGLYNFLEIPTKYQVAVHMNSQDYVN